MNLRIAWRFGVLLAIGAFVYWIATHTYWADETVSRGPSGEALRDPFYVAERLSRALGARASYERFWKLPDKNAVVVAESWDWDRSSRERAQLQHWVESGGRLVTDLSFFGDEDTFIAWSGITRRYPKLREQTGKSRPHHAIMRLRARNVVVLQEECHEGEESGVSSWPASATPRRYDLCGIDGYGFLASTRAPVWQVTDTAGAQALRIAVGRGSISVVNGEPFTYRDLLEGTNAALFVAATQLRAGDEIDFLTDQDHASLLALSWRFGAPVIVLLLGALVLALWRAAPRFGPAMASPESARRSLAEQIRGTGQFLLRVGDGQALHAATVRALFAAAPRRIGAFASLSGAERVSRLASATGFSADALAEAINYTGARRTNELRSTIALLEAARREILRNNNRSTDGN